MVLTGCTTLNPGRCAIAFIGQYRRHWLYLKSVIKPPEGTADEQLLYF